MPVRMSLDLQERLARPGRAGVAAGAEEQGLILMVAEPLYFAGLPSRDYRDMAAQSNNKASLSPALLSSGNPTTLRKLAAFLHRHGWEFILLLFFLTLAFGYVGFDQYWTEQGKQYPPQTLLYQSLLLFSMQSSDAAGQVNLPLEVGRWLAVIVFGSAVVKTIVALLRNRLRRLRVRRWRRHTLICGWSENARRWTQNLREQRLAMLTRVPVPEAIEWCEDLHLPLFSGEAHLEDTLWQMNTPQAATIFCVDDDDAANIAVAAAIHQMPCLPGHQPTCFVQIGDPLLFSLMAEADLKTSHRGCADLEYFNPYDRGARELLNAFPLLGEADGPPPRLVMAGLGALGERLLIHTVRTWWRLGPPDQQLPIALVAPDASGRLATLTARYPVLHQIIAWRCLDQEPRTLPGYGFNPFPDVEGPIRAFVCLEDDGAGLTAGLLLARAFEGQDATVVTALNGDTASFATLLRTNPVLHIVSWRERVCSVDLLQSGITEIFARAQHEEYVRTELAKQREQRARGEEPAPNAVLVPWEALTEDKKKANRDQLNDLGNKLKAIGCTILEDLELHEPWTLAAEEIELLSQMEHDRWMRERLAQGWVWGAVRDNAKKIHPDLIPWADLTEEVKEKDRVMVRNIPNALATVGLRVYRLPVAPRG